MLRSVLFCCVILFCRLIIMTGGGGFLILLTITMVEAHFDKGVFDTVWHKHVPLKVSLFAWRLFHERLPTKDNLARHRVLHTDDTMCMGACGELETADNLLFSCDTFGSVWSFILQWLGLSFVAHARSRVHLL